MCAIGGSGEAVLSILALTHPGVEHTYIYTPTYG